MLFLSKCFAAACTVAFSISAAGAADTVASGKIKSINADKKTFVLTDAKDADWTFALGDKVVIDRDGKEGKTELKAGDPINVSYDKGTLTWTANFILIREGVSKDYILVRGSVKSYDAENKTLTFTDDANADTVYPVGKAVVRFNWEAGKMENASIGDHALLIVKVVDGKSTLKSVMIDRANK